MSLFPNNWRRHDLRSCERSFAFVIGIPNCIFTVVFIRQRLNYNERHYYNYKTPFFINSFAITIAGGIPTAFDVKGRLEMGRNCYKPDDFKEQVCLVIFYLGNNH